MSFEKGPNNNEGSDVDVSNKAEKLFNKVEDVKKQVEEAKRRKEKDVQKKADQVENISPQLRELHDSLESLQENMEFYEDQKDSLDEESLKTMEDTKNTISDIETNIEELENLAKDLISNPDIQAAVQTRAGEENKEVDEQIEKEAKTQEQAEEMYEKYDSILKKVELGIEENRKELDKKHTQFLTDQEFNTLGKEIEEKYKKIEKNKSASFRKQTKQAAAEELSKKLQDQRAGFVSDSVNIYNQVLDFTNSQTSDRDIENSLSYIWEASLSMYDKELGKEISKRKEELLKKVEELHKYNWALSEDRQQRINELFEEVKK